MNYSDTTERKSLKNQGLVATGALGTVALVAVSDSPASAAGVEDITAMVTSLGGIATAVTVVVLGAMGVRLGVKIVNRMTVKG